MLRFQNLSLRAEALNSERVALGQAIAGKYFPGRLIAGVTIGPDGTIAAV